MRPSSAFPLGGRCLAEGQTDEGAGFEGGTYIGRGLPDAPPYGIPQGRHTGPPACFYACPQMA